LLTALVALLERNESVDSLASELIGNTDDSSFGDLVCSDCQLAPAAYFAMLLTVFNKSGLNLGSRQPVSRDVDNVIDTTANPVVSIVVTASAISSELEQYSQPSVLEEIVRMKYLT
jgi:hypothetical protein